MQIRHGITGSSGITSSTRSQGGFTYFDRRNKIVGEDIVQSPLDLELVVCAVEELLISTISTRPIDHDSSTQETTDKSRQVPLVESIVGLFRLMCSIIPASGRDDWLHDDGSDNSGAWQGALRTGA